MRLNGHKKYLKQKNCFIFDLDGTLVDSMRYFRLMQEGYTLAQVYELLIPKYIESIQAKPGALDFLKLLNEQGKECFIATATDLKICGPCIKRLGFSEYIKKSFCCVDFGVRKNSPLFYEGVLAETGYKKEEVIIFEDNANWAKVAFDNGFDIVGVFDQESHKTKMKSFAIDYIYTFEDLMSKSHYSVKKI